MLVRLFVAVVVLASTALIAQEDASRLPYRVPDGWTRHSDGRTLLPPGGQAAMTFLPSTAFAGTGEQWMTESWNGFRQELKLIAEAEPGRQGRFLTRLGQFQQADGTNVWVVLNTLVHAGRGETVIFFATDQETFRAHLPTLSAMLQAMPAPPAPASGSSPAPELMKKAAPATASDEPPAVAGQGSTRAMNKTLTLDDYEFIPPVGWLVQKHPDHILLTQSPDQSGCVIQVLAPQPSSADLEQHASTVFEMMYPGWQYQKAGEQQYTLSRGGLPTGLEFFMKEAAMSATSANGRYHLEEGAALVMKAGSQVAIVAVRHRGTLAHNECQNNYATWRRFFNSFTVKGTAGVGPGAADPVKRIVGVWSQSGGGAIGEYVFAANGHYALAGGFGSSSTSRDDRHEYLHLRSHAWNGDGTYAIAGSQLTLNRRGGNRPEQVRFRFEQVNHGGAGWKDRLWLLKRDSVGEVEVAYEKKPTPVSAQPLTASPPSPSMSPPPPTSAQAPPVRRGPPIRDAAEVAGLYRHLRQVFDASPFGPPGSGHGAVRMLYYLLSSDGRVFRGVNLPDVPGGDIETFDFDAAQRRSPKDAGTYQVKGNEVILTLGAAPRKVTVAARSRDTLQIDDPEFTYGNRSFVRTIRALPPTAAERTPAKQPKVVPVSIASIPDRIAGWPTLVYQAPPGFTDPTGIGRHSSRPHWHARVEVYDFRPYAGKDFEQEFRATRLRDWLRRESREDEMVGGPEFDTGNLDGADQMLSVGFAEKSHELRTLEGEPGAFRQTHNRDVPRIRSRIAILASGAVALIDVVLRDPEALAKHEASINAFTESVKILPVPPPMTREDILGIAGVWQWDGGPGYGSEALPHHERAATPTYLFSIDGRVLWEAPPSVDFRNPADFDRISGIAGHTAGSYFKRGEQVVMRFGAPPYYVYAATIKGPDTLEILGYTYHRTLRGDP